MSSIKEALWLGDSCHFGWQNV